jgi:ABC-type Na+ transport system ATPase subunit NatA
MQFVISKGDVTLRAIMLCSLLDPATGTAASPAVDAAHQATLAKRYESGKLKEGSTLYARYKDLDQVWSVTLLHEMFHEVFLDRSKHPPSPAF